MTPSVTRPAGRVQQFLRVEDVSHYYVSSKGALQALDRCTMQITPGEFTSIVGPSGCGKSTLLHLIAGVVRPTHGTITIAGQEITEPYDEQGIVFQTDVLLDWRNALDNVLLQVELRRRRRSDYVERATELLENVGLAGFERRHPYELSGGMRQRVAICRALLHDPKLLLMDEPFGALDAITRDRIGLELQGLFRATDRMMLFVTHSIQEAVFLSDRVLVMSPRPGAIAQEIEVDLPRPRTLDMRTDTRFVDLVGIITESLESMGVFGDRSKGLPNV
jgi:NitT/TauT family transport system ATP-binding protein